MSHEIRTDVGWNGNGGGGWGGGRLGREVKAIGRRSYGCGECVGRTGTDK